MVGKGLAIWPDVNIEDGLSYKFLIQDIDPLTRQIFSVGDLYMVIFDAVTKDKPTAGHGREGFYFAENGEHSWYSISKQISLVLAAKGIAANDEPTTLTADELVKYWGSEVTLRFDSWRSCSSLR